MNRSKQKGTAWERRLDEEVGVVSLQPDGDVADEIWRVAER